MGGPGRTSPSLAFPYRTTFMVLCRLEVTDAGAPVGVADGAVRTGCLVPGDVGHGRRLQPGRPLQIDAGEVGAGEVGPREVRPLQVSITKVGPRQARSEEDRAGQVGP